LAASAALQYPSPELSLSAGRVRVSAQLRHSPPGPATPLQPISPRLVHAGFRAASTNVRGAQSKPSSVRQFRHRVLSKVTRCRHTGHVNARI
jgi:hypothetical protein